MKLRCNKNYLDDFAVDNRYEVGRHWFTSAEVRQCYEEQCSGNGDLTLEEFTATYFTEYYGKGERPNGRHNLMRNVMKLQNYSPSIMRTVLSGKAGSTIDISYRSMTSVDDWKTLYAQAIEDINAGYYVPGKPTKSEVSYWEKQFVLLDEFLKNRY